MQSKERDWLLQDLQASRARPALFNHCADFSLGWLIRWVYCLTEPAQTDCFGRLVSLRVCHHSASVFSWRNSKPQKRCGRTCIIQRLIPSVFVCVCACTVIVIFLFCAHWDLQRCLVRSHSSSCVRVTPSPWLQGAMFNQAPCKTLQAVIDLSCTYTHTQTHLEACVTFLAVSKVSIFSPSLFLCSYWEWERKYQ